MTNKINIIDDININNMSIPKINNNGEIMVKQIKKEEDDAIINENKLNENKLNELRAKLNKKTENKSVSLKFGVIGCGHAGSRLAEAFYNLQYDAIAMNTATQDLTHINLPNENKLFMDVGIQGAAKDLARGEEAANTYRSKIQELIYDKLDSSQVFVVCSSAGGGSGAGSLSTIIDICNTTGKPIVIMSILPMVSEDVRTKSNSLETISKLTSFIRQGKAHSFILIDNAKIENIHSGVGQMDFYRVANKAIVEPLDIFNTYSMLPSQVKGLDSAEWATILLNSGGISTYGQIVINNYEGETAIAEAIIASLQENMLAGGLDYKQAKYVGYIILANANVWKKIPTGATNYANALINDLFGNPEGTYKGIYEAADMSEDVVKIYTFVSGLGIPGDRIAGLKRDIDMQQMNLKVKDDDRNKQLKIDVGKDSVVSDVDKLKAKISARMSGLGKLTTNLTGSKK